MKSRLESALTVCVSTILRKCLSVATSRVSLADLLRSDTRVHNVMPFREGIPAATPCANLPPFAIGSRLDRASAA